MRALWTSALLFAAALAATACASAPPAERAPFRPYQLAPQPDLEADAKPKPRPRPSRPEPLEEQPAYRVDAALLAFAYNQRNLRTVTPRRSPMPEEARKNWTELIRELDRFLAQGVRTTIPLDVVRARVTIDAELALDAAHYSEVPIDLPGAVKARSLALDQRLQKVRRLAVAAKPPPARLVWPIEPVVVTSLFGARADPFSGEGKMHLGVDLRAQHRQLIQAAAPGVVTRAGWTGGHGMYVELEHGNGVTTSYSHMSTILVTAGMQVPVRGPLGLAGSTGRSTGPHLHFELRRDGTAIDPLNELPDPAYQELSVENIGDGE